MKTENLFYLAIIFLILGMTLIGLGLGCLFQQICEGIIIGLGFGLTFTTFIILKIFRRREAYAKK